MLKARGSGLMAHEQEKFRVGSPGPSPSANFSWPWARSQESWATSLEAWALSYEPWATINNRLVNCSKFQSYKVSKFQSSPNLHFPTWYISKKMQRAFSQNTWDFPKQYFPGVIWFSWINLSNSAETREPKSRIMFGGIPQIPKFPKRHYFCPKWY